jgi:hypothetical protein
MAGSHFRNASCPWPCIATIPARNAAASTSTTTIVFPLIAILRFVGQTLGLLFGPNADRSVCHRAERSEQRLNAG